MINVDLFDLIIFQISFIMKYDYRNTTTALQSENKEPEIVWLQYPILINLGALTP
jgi:heme/copper-type cytochrome/quinol oxidase subunit 2